MRGCTGSKGSRGRGAGGGRLGTETILVTFLPWLQNPSGHSFLTKEELLQRCAQKAPRVSAEEGTMGLSGSGSDPETGHQRLPFLGARSAMGHRELDTW